MARRSKSPPIKPAANGGARAGRSEPARTTGPKARPGPRAKVTVVLDSRQITFLNRIAAGVRAHGGGPVRRAQLIRVLIDACAEADLDLTAARSEADLKNTLLARLGRYRVTF